MSQLPLTRQLFEVVKIERPVYGVQTKYPLIAFTTVKDFNLEQAKGNVEVGHRTQRTEGSFAQEVKHAGRKLLQGFFARHVGFQAADAGHFRGLQQIQPVYRKWNQSPTTVAISARLKMTLSRCSAAVSAAGLRSRARTAVT